MTNRIDILKGIHPGKLIERDLKKMHLSQRALAEDTSIQYQTINAIIAGRRNLTTQQALSIEKIMGYEEGFLSILQAFYEIKQYKDKEYNKQYTSPPHIRKSLFWDTDFDKINWGKYKKAVITRVLERGNKEEQEEIICYYNLKPNEADSYRPQNKRAIPSNHD
ncbi:HigA family addiction module antitoxin [Dysgonomonas sp. 511]|uniref:HigA family addiction module antitoxin n=1 Tax=Dysgonomonas sp. 511 TaxID=2302930 RepID=UPI0013D0CB37|nr:HigA family addiction module antitoxin [Dysgonomonas sp. 511]NDV80296.1 addiction module antidote protein, HigA family [Dysgonomonas sp. 511]